MAKAVSVEQRRAPAGLRRIGPLVRCQPTLWQRFGNPESPHACRESSSRLLTRQPRRIGGGSGPREERRTWTEVTCALSRRKPSVRLGLRNDSGPEMIASAQSSHLSAHVGHFCACVRVRPWPAQKPVVAGRSSPSDRRACGVRVHTRGCGACVRRGEDGGDVRYYAFRYMYVSLDFSALHRLQSPTHTQC